MKTLAAVLVDIAQSYEVVENVAAEFFGILRREDVNDLEHLNEIVSAAYAANGWSQVKGRPPTGSTDKPAPDIVQTYVSRARTGFNRGLDVKAFETMYQLREALKGMKESHSAPERLPELAGVQIAKENKLTGALCHDVGVFILKLPEDKRLEMEDRIRKVMNRYERYVQKVLSAA